MRSQRFGFAALAASLAFTPVPVTRPALAATAETPSDLTARVAELLPSVAEIKTTKTAPQGSSFFYGTGFVIDPSGLIATNRHVIAGASEITVTLPGLPPFPAEPVYVSTRVDFAIVKVGAGRPLPAVKLGDSETVKMGEPVLLIGNPFGSGTAVSSGVISALNRDLGDSMYDHFFQTDAALNHGNSGGPMFNMNGEVIGINTALVSSPGNTGSIGLGFAIPINDAKFAFDQFLKVGRVSVSTIGIRGQRITKDLAVGFGLDSTRGAVVTEVDPKGPAVGKVFAGDIILRVNDQDASDIAAVARLIAVTPAGEAVRMQLVRGGDEKNVAITVKQLTTDPKAAMTAVGRAPMETVAFARPSNPGMKFMPITEEMRAKLGLQPDERGVIVTEVDPKSAAGKLQISANDVIEIVGNRVVSTQEEVQEALHAISDQDRRIAPLLVRGERGPRWVPLPLDADR